MSLSKENAYYLIVVLAAIVLAFPNLGANAFWDDEAQVGIMGKNFARSGQLTGVNDTNLFTFRNGTLLDSNFKPKNSPVDYIIAGLSFRLFGASTWAGRLPFVVFGLLALFAFLALLREEFGNSRVALYAFPLMSLNYAFFLNIRQCRYYSVALLLAILTMLWYKKFVRTNQWHYALAATLAAVMLYFTQYLLSVAFLMALAITHIVFHHRKLGRRFWIIFGLSALALTLVILPHAIQNQIWVRPDQAEMPQEANAFLRKLSLLYWNIRELDVAAYLPGFGLVFLVVAMITLRKKSYLPPLTYEYGFMLAVFIVLLSLFSNQPVTWQGYAGGLAEIRYLLIILPWCAVLCGVLCVIVERAMGAAMGAILAVLLLCTNVFAFNITNQPFRWLLPGYIREALVDYTTPYDAVIEHLKANAHKGEMVYSMPEFTQNTLMFYLGDSLNICGVLRPGTPLPNDKLRALPYPVFIDDCFPDWIVSYAINLERQKMLQFFSRDKYTYQLHTRLSQFWRDMTRPELPWHSFKEPPAPPPNSSMAIFVFKRQEKQPVPAQQPPPASPAVGK